MEFRKKQVRIIYNSVRYTLEEQINKELLKFENPNDIIDVKFATVGEDGDNRAMIIYWED